MKKVTRDTLKSRWFLSSATNIGLAICLLMPVLFIAWIYARQSTLEFAEKSFAVPKTMMLSVLLFFMGSPLVVLVANWWWYLRPFKDRVRKHDWRLCPKCAYPFQGSGEVTCTECGEKFVGDEIRNAWRGWIKPVGWWKRWRPDT